MPRKTQRSDNVVRSVTHPVKFTSVEYGQLKIEAYQKKISVAELIRFAALSRGVKKMPPCPELDEKFLRQLQEVGKPLNVIAKKANTQLLADLALTLKASEIQNLVLELSKILQDILLVVSEQSPQYGAIESRRRFNSAPLSHTRSIRLAPDEYERLKEKAALARTSVSKFLRLAALRQQVVSPPPPPISYWRIHQELSSINNNLRQLLRAVNTVEYEIEFPHTVVEQALAQIQSVGWQLLGVNDEEAEDT